MPPRHIRKTFFKILLFIIITLTIPTAFTLFFGKKTEGRIYVTSDSGRFITMEANGITEKMDVESFIPCAIMGQLSIENEEELLKSFAVIIRTYIYKEMGDKDSISADKLNIPYVSYSEMEALWEDKFPDNYNRLMKIMSNTSLEIITSNGNVISPYYHSISGGNTRSGNEVLGEEFSYMCSAACPDDKASTDYFKAYYYENADFAKLVRTIDSEIIIDDTAPLENVQIVSRDGAGYVMDLTIGNRTVNGTSFYEAMNINSPSFMIEEYNGGVRITTYGKGHGLGVSLCYASVLAKNGSSYKEILNYFYTNIDISSVKSDAL